MPEKILTKIVLPHPRVQCPKCNGYLLAQTGTDFPVRYYSCLDCGVSFQTYDDGPRARATGITQRAS